LSCSYVPPQVSENSAKKSIFTMVDFKSELRQQKNTNKTKKQIENQPRQSTKRTTKQQQKQAKHETQVISWSVKLMELARCIVKVSDLLGRNFWDAPQLVARFSKSLWQSQFLHL
jgi:hypothetical protein